MPVRMVGIASACCHYTVGHYHSSDVLLEISEAGIWRSFLPLCCCCCQSLAFANACVSGAPQSASALSVIDSGDPRSHVA
jgi:hypothetical protein